MGFFRLIKRITRMVSRDILFKIPKKYLVVIIMFLSIFVLKSNVFAYSDYDYINVDDPIIDNVYYKYVRIDDGYIFDTGYPSPYYIDSSDFRNNYEFVIKCNFMDSGAWGYVFHNGDVNNPSNFGMWYRDVRYNLYFGYFGQNNDLSAYTRGLDYEFDINMLPTGDNVNPSYVVYQGNSLWTQGNMTIGSTQVNTTKTDTIHLGYSSGIKYENFKIYTKNELNQYVLQLNLYPCKYRDSSGQSIQYLPGFYDTVSETFIYYSHLIFDDNDILSVPPEEVIPPEPTPTPTPSDSAIVGGLSNIDNSINNMNNFLQDNTISNSAVNITTPSISNTQVVNSADNIFSSFIGDFASLLDTNREAQMKIYIPNYLTNSGQEFITVRSYLVRDFLASTNVIPGLNLTVLDIVQTLWSVCFGWWFFNIILGFINGVYSGEIISDKGLKELTKSYTGVMSNML